ncbi:S1 RNA-binding domain-containing protein [Streptomyces marokkonensis]|uniref:S1 RNA-binding domain-containing protein n=1 Tax=Streptomyces marokkonensis TaxID=324855 RepID=A0ABW6PYD5_9ACTN
MIDSFRAAAECAEEALCDPGGLRFAHLPSLVAFVTRLRGDHDEAEWDPRDLTEGVRLNRLLWELGLRGEAAQLFDWLRTRLLGLMADTDGTVAAGNALAAVGMRLGRGEDVREFLEPTASEAAGSDVDDVLVVITGINLAVVALTLGDFGSAARQARTARRLLGSLDAPHSAELHEVLAAVEWRLADGGHGQLPGGGEPFRPTPGEGRRPAPASPLSAFAARAAALVREVGDNDPRAFFSVAGLAVARVTAAVRDGDTRSLTTSVQVLEVTCQRLSAMLGADHPEVLGVLADLAAVQVEAARVTRSSARLERAVAQLASVSGRLDARLGPEHPRSVATLTNLVTAQVESVRASNEADKADKAERTAEALTEQARQAGERLGEHHPVTRLVRASSRTCLRIASRGDDLWGRGSTMLITLADMPSGWATHGGAYRSFDETMGQLGRGGRTTDPYERARSRFQESLESLSALLAEPLRRREPAPGDLVFGTVVGWRSGALLLSLDDAPGIVPADELSLRRDADPRLIAGAGDRVQTMALGRRDAEGNAVLSVRRALSVRAWSDLEAVRARNGSVTGTVIDLVRGGLVVDVGVRAFMPSDLADRQRGARLRRLLGTPVKAKIIELDRYRGLVHLSRRAQLEVAEALPSAAGAWRSGQIRTGPVTEVLRSGALVDIGGVVGRVPRSELSWLHVDDPSDIVSVGQEVTVRVLGPDSDGRGPALSLKAARDDPWRAFTTSHRLGEIVEVTVTKQLSFGLLVRVGEGIDGLVHRSELADRRASGPEGTARAGEHLFVAVTDIDYDRRRLSFSLREAHQALDVDPDGDWPDLARYGMAEHYDGRGELVHPDGFDAEADTWLPGSWGQREKWERQRRDAVSRYLRHEAWASRWHAR